MMSYLKLLAAAFLATTMLSGGDAARSLHAQAAPVPEPASDSAPAAGSGSATEVELPPQVMDGIAAVVDDHIITNSELQLLLGGLEAALQKNAAEMKWDSARLSAELKTHRDNALDALINQRLVLLEYSPQIPVSTEALDNHVQRLIRDTFNNDESALLRTLEKGGMTLQSYRDNVREQFIISAVQTEYIKKPAEEAVYGPKDKYDASKETRSEDALTALVMDERDKRIKALLQQLKAKHFVQIY